jgi:hypothetical protein
MSLSRDVPGRVLAGCTKRGRPVRAPGVGLCARSTRACGPRSVVSIVALCAVGACLLAGGVAIAEAARGWRTRLCGARSPSGRASLARHPWLDTFILPARRTRVLHERRGDNAANTRASHRRRRSVRVSHSRTHREGGTTARHLLQCRRGVAPSCHRDVVSATCGRVAVPGLLYARTRLRVPTACMCRAGPVWNDRSVWDTSHPDLRNEDPRARAWPT